ncbi:MAG: hypothetical protein P8Y23_10365 [Candidatus Lokiarchaeota archaeon]|jgi:hypothetical protein
MRIKIIEKIIPIDMLFSTITKVFNSQLIISENSHVSDDYLLVLGISEKGIIIIIHASLDYDFERTYISVILYNISSLSEILEQDFSIQDVKLAEEELVKALKINGKENIKYPFTDLSQFQIESGQRKRKIFSLENKIISAIIKDLYNRISYSDDIMKYPFSITSINGKWEEWEDLYHLYLNSIEKGIINTGLEHTKIYRDYDFAQEADIFQRMFDLVLVSKRETDPEVLAQHNEDKLLFDYELTFIYCNRSYKPYSYMDLLKLMNEVKNFATKFKSNNKSLCFHIRMNLILISSSGYEPKIKEYLREHLFREIDYTFPIIVIPPMQGDIWHNFFEYDDLIDSKQKKREELGKIIRISKMNEVSPSFRVTRLKDAKNEYEDIIERERMAKVDKDYLRKWFWILNVPKSHKLITRKRKHESDGKSPSLIHEKIEIS